MTRDDIIRMAREADLYVGTNMSGVVLVGAAKSNGLLLHMTVEDLERFAALVVAAEREACAKVCEEHKVGVASYFEIDEYIQECADAIRARSNT